MIRSDSKYERYAEECTTIHFGLKRSSFICLCTGGSSLHEFLFGNFFDGVDEFMLSIDSVERKLGFIRLRLHRTAVEAVVYAAWKQGGLVPMGSIKHRVHVVRTNRAVPPLRKDVQRKRNFISLRDAEKGRRYELY